MKIKLFLSTSLLALGVWLAAAYNHTVDLSSYTQPEVTPVQVKAEVEATSDKAAEETLPDLAATQ